MNKRLLCAACVLAVFAMIGANPATPTRGQSSTPAATMAATMPATMAATMPATMAATMAATMPATKAAAVNAGATLSAVYTLEDTPIGALQNAVLKDSVKNDRKILLGGVGSDMWHDTGAPADEFWMITDRGPNGQIKVDDKNRRTFPIPEFTPLILKVKASGKTFKVIETIPITTQTGKPVTGLPNLATYDEQGYDYSAQTKIDGNINGLDSEGLVRTTAGDFWVADEYSPSLLKIDKTGKVVKRYVPEGLDLKGADYPVANLFPAIFTKRKVNRGFESLAITPDQKTLYIGLQSPLSNPDSKIGNASRQTRILAFDIATEKLTAEYVYQFDDAIAFGGEKNTPDEMKISAMSFISEGKLLVEERTDKVAKLYTIDLSKGVNILGTAWDDLKTAPGLEALTDLAAAKVTALPKTLVLDLSKFPESPDKIEGIAILDKNTVAVANDNDFDLGGTFGADGNLTGAGVKCRILVFKLDKALE